MPAEIAHTDQVLLQQLSRGERKAFEAIYHKYWWPLVDHAWKRLKDKQQAEDIVQDVFCKLWAKRAALQVQHLEAYLHTAVRYEILNYFSRSRQPHAFLEPFHELLEGGTTPENELVARNLLQLAYAYAQTLPEKRRQIFLLHIQSRYSTKEIAWVLDISQKTVQNQLGTALKRLRTGLAPLILWCISLRYLLLIPAPLFL
ncbi:RNA polymerase sigma factor [Chitinophaga japonensis]|nr:RNA polymerase sigma-70 factor [Chitinophaga japonensis]